MGWDGLLGNARLKQNLQAALKKGRISHFYVISGPAGSGKRTLARLLATAILCRNGHSLCGTCPACRKVLGAGHPDFITVDDPEKKHVPIDLVRRAREDVYIRPNEGSHKIYLFPRAQNLRPESQNALLKVLEEPPSYGVFLLLTDNPEKLLPTIRSRCTELSMLPLPQGEVSHELKLRLPAAAPALVETAAARSGGWLGQALTMAQEGAQLPPQTQSFLEAYAGKDTFALTRLLVPMEKLKRDQLTELLEQWAGCLEGALVHRSGMAVTTPMADRLAASRSAAELMDAIGHLQKCIHYAQGNTSPAAICGYLLWALQ